ncbi:uncharacterized protein LOC132786686 [Drosophila nasuta]|uniref:uncharacterized protein LOC132786686 n=1 Tax=Drosophila nasuta TaxID=42062 RepID=UPI00295E5F79|nr:uncharacterized protein LOC132786686 [Drosophila nasuta]
MSNTMTAAHEPTMHYLDSILNEEEKRCGDQYSHQWRNFTISRSGRFRSKNKKRDVVDGKLFDGSNAKENNDKISARNTAKSSSYSATPTIGSSNNNTSIAPTATGTTTTSVRSQRDKTESYKSFYETNL